ncbi:hypothetical protein ACTFIW_000932 [Dictyostelium discoideum]
MKTESPEWGFLLPLEALRYVVTWRTGHTCELVSSNDVNSKNDKTPFLCSLALKTEPLINYSTLQETVAIVNPVVGFSEEQEVNLPVGGRLFHHTQVWKEWGLPNFCQEVANGLKVHLLPNFKPMPNPIPISILECPKSDCITKEVLMFHWKIYLELKQLI